MAVQIATYRFNVDKYYRLAEIGVLAPDERVELLDGRIWEMHPPVPRRFSADEYSRMIEHGILTKDDRVELIDGEIILMTPIGTRRAACVDRLTMLLSRLANDDAIVRVQGPLHLDADTEPQPDVMLLKKRPDYYAEKHPEPVDVLLLIEVADSTVGSDKSLKMPHFARSGIAEVWLVNLPEGVIEVYSKPGPAGFGLIQLFRPGEELPMAALGGVRIKASDILGSAG